MTVIAGKKSDVYVTAGASVSMPNEPMNDIAAAGFTARTTYAVTNAVKRYFDPATPIVFQRSLDSGGTWNPVTPDFVYAGSIQFIAQQQASPLAQFRVQSGNYLPYTRMGGGHEWNLNPAVLILEASEFGHTSHHHVGVPLAEGTCQIKRWWYDDSLRSVLGNLMVLVLFEDATSQPAGPRFEVLAILKADALKAAVMSLVTEDTTFELQSTTQFLGV